MRSRVGRAYDRARVKIARKADRVLADKGRLIIDGVEHDDTPCEINGGSGDVNGATYRVKFAWDAPAAIGATLVVEAIEGRGELTLQLTEPIDSSTAIWQEWRAMSAPNYGRANVGL